jgi:hypothetical protein
MLLPLSEWHWIQELSKIFIISSGIGLFAISVAMLSWLVNDVSRRPPTKTAVNTTAKIRIFFIVKDLIVCY